MDTYMQTHTCGTHPPATNTDTSGHLQTDMREDKTQTHIQTAREKHVTLLRVGVQPHGHTETPPQGTCM